MPFPSSGEVTRHIRLLAAQSGPPPSKKGTREYSTLTSTALGLPNFLNSIRGYFQVTVPSLPPPPPPVEEFGSMRFVGGGVSVQTNVSYPNDAALRPGTGAFTVEWFQYYEDSDTNAIVFSIGTFGSTGNDLCVVYVGTTMFLFTDGTSSNVATAVTKNQWQHIAVVGNGGADGSRNTKVYVDGQLKLTRTTNYNINQTDVLRIGNQTNPNIANGNYAGLITNFRWVVGSQVYTEAFTPPTSALTEIPGTELLLLAQNSESVVTDSSSRGRIAINNGVTFDSSTPF
jgi:hypothetical protein